MTESNTRSSFIMGLLVCIGLALLGYFIAGGIVKFKSLDRTITVKGLSEREVPADVVIWPIRFSEADNDLAAVFSKIQTNNTKIVRFLAINGIKDNEITVSTPSINDRQVQQYGGNDEGKLRYSGNSTITVYSQNVELVRTTMSKIIELGKQGIAISQQDYQSRTEFLFTNLNAYKPVMIEEATKNAREVAEKFAQDSHSKLGKIKKASQGQFSISDRDESTPHIKKIRVVSTIEYYLSD